MRWWEVRRKNHYLDESHLDYDTGQAKASSAFHMSWWWKQFHFCSIHHYVVRENDAKARCTKGRPNNQDCLLNCILSQRVRLNGRYEDSSYDLEKFHIGHLAWTRMTWGREVEDLQKRAQQGISFWWQENSKLTNEKSWSSVLSCIWWVADSNGLKK
jgi:hypothetical protein